MDLDLRPMTFRYLTLLIAFASAAPLTASPGSVQDFQLPAPTPSATNTPQVQGPVDTEAGVPIRPRVIPTGTPAATPSAIPTTTATQPAEPPTGAATPAATVARPPTQPVQRSVQRQPGPLAQPTMVAPADPASTSSNPLTDQPTGTASNLDFTPDLSSEAAVPTPAVAADSLPFNYMWWIAAVIAAIAILAGLYFYRPRGVAAAGAPEIEPPLSRRHPEPQPEPGPNQRQGKAVQPTTPPATAQSAVLPPLPIQLKAQAISLSRSLMNATLSYRLNLTNLGTQMLSEISIRADVVTAHGRAPVNQQLADVDSDLDVVGVVGEIRPSDSHDIRTEFKLPVGSIKTITQGRAQLFVPLLRVRIEVDGKEPMIKTFVVGMTPQAGRGKLHPFRLDEMAQTYREIGLRALT